MKKIELVFLSPTASDGRAHLRTDKISPPPRAENLVVRRITYEATNSVQENLLDMLGELHLADCNASEVPVLSFIEKIAALCFKAGRDYQSEVFVKTDPNRHNMHF